MSKKLALIVGDDTFSADLMSHIAESYILGRKVFYGKTANEVIKSLKDVIAEAKVVLFTGGADLNPSLYGDTSRGMCGFSKVRDDIDIFMYNLCRNIPKLGICRGHQFLNIRTGGKLIHHVENHSRKHRHLMRTYDGRMIVVNSIHHQLIKPTRTTVVLGEYYPKDTNDTYFGNEDKKEDYKGPDVEAAWFKMVNGFGVQYHPEFMSDGEPAREWFLEKASALINGEDLAETKDNMEDKNESSVWLQRQG